jgi:RecJ-like exonuclease
MKQREYRIDIKRFNTATIKIDPVLHKRSCDIADNYSNLLFKGTSNDLSYFLKRTNEADFKVLGVHDIYPEGMEMCKDCDGNGEEDELYSCCGDVLDTDTWLCKSCGEHCDGTEANECDTCDGKGYVPKLPIT